VHGLVALRRKIDDRKPSIAQANSRRRVDPGTFIVRATVRQGVRHCDHASAHRLGSASPARIKETCNAAHDQPSDLECGLAPV
jgi:hypothetical protein